MARLTIEIPVWIIEYIDEQTMLYEMSRLLRECIDLIVSAERGYVRTDPERVLKRIVAKLTLAKTMCELIISVRKERVSEEFRKLHEEIEKMYTNLKEKVGKV